MSKYSDFWGSDPEQLPQFVLLQVEDIKHFKDKKMRFGDVLVYREYATRENMEKWHSEKPQGVPFGEYLQSLPPSVVGRGLKDALFPAIAATLEEPMLYISAADFSAVGVSPVFSDAVVRKECEQFNCLPVLIGDSRFLAFGSIDDVNRWKTLGPMEARKSALNNSFAAKAALCLCDPASIAVQSGNYSVERAGAADDSLVWKETELDTSGEEEQRWIAKLMNYVIKEGASDFHISPLPSGLGVNVELRIDTMLQPCPSQLMLTEDLYHKVKRYLVNKSMATKDNSPVFVPVDGEAVNYVPKAGGGRRLRLSFVPLGIDGNANNNLVRIVARCQPLDGSVKSLDELNFVSTLAIEHLREMVSTRSGLILMAGPMGSGKTATMYAILKAMVEHYAGSLCIASIEDPVEQRIEGVNQIEVSRHAHEQGLGYRDYLKALKRQDTNILYLGEIRDEETAINTGQFASIGNAVLTTVHAGDEVQTIVRLASLIPRPQDWELMVSGLRYVMTQRLIPCLCGHCKIEVPFESEEKNKLKKHLIKQGYNEGEAAMELADLRVVFDKGTSDCSVCNGTRYQKIVPVIGILPFDEQLRDLLLDKDQPGKLVREQLRKKRVTTMSQQVIELVRQGVASIEAMEVLNHG